MSSLRETEWNLRNDSKSSKIKPSEILLNISILLLNSVELFWKIVGIFGISASTAQNVFDPEEVFNFVYILLTSEVAEEISPDIHSAVDSLLTLGRIEVCFSPRRNSLEYLLKIYASIVNEVVPNMNWVEFFSHVEKKSSSKLDAGKGESFAMFLGFVFEDVSNFPTHCLYSIWQCREFQLYTIKAVIQDSPELIIGTPENHKLILQPEVLSKFSPHFANGLIKSPFNSLDLIDCLLLFLQDSLYAEVKEIIDKGIQRYPELILLGLSKSKIQWNALYREFTPGLVLLFVMGHPSSSFVLPLLCEINKSLVVTGLIHLHMKCPTYLPRILEVAQEINSLPELLETKSYNFSLDLAIIAGENDLLNLFVWLQDHFNSEGEEFMKVCLNFFDEKIDRQANPENFEFSPEAPDTLLEANNPEQHSYQSQSNNTQKDFQNQNFFINKEAPCPKFVPEDRHRDFLKKKPEQLSLYAVSKFLNFFLTNSSAVSPKTLEHIKMLCSKIFSAYPQFSTILQRRSPEEHNKSEQPIEAENTEFSTEVSNESMNLYKRLYKGDLTVKQIVSIMRRMQISTNPNSNAIYNCMVQYLLDEYEFLHSYWDKQLMTTAFLYGALIKLNLMDPRPMGIALQYVLDALRRSADSPYLRFGLCAVNIFKQRLVEWKQYSRMILHIPTLHEIAPSLIKYIQSFIQPIDKNPDAMNEPLEDQYRDASQEARRAYKQWKHELPAGQRSDHPVERQAEPTKEPNTEEPYEKVRDSILFIINNISESNVGEKAVQIKKYLDKSVNKWLSHYIVTKRVSFEPNFCGLYISFLEKIEDKSFEEQVISSTYQVINELTSAVKTNHIYQARLNLKNLGIWLGSITLAKNRPIKHKELSFKHFLIASFERQTLSATVPFVCKVLEKAGPKTVFAPPNPWTMSVVSMLVELYKYAHMKLNLNLQIEILLKNINLEINNVQPTEIFRNIRRNKAPEMADLGIQDRYLQNLGLNSFLPEKHGDISQGNQNYSPQGPLSSSRARYAMPLAQNQQTPNRHRPNQSHDSGEEKKMDANQYFTSSRGLPSRGARSQDSQISLKKIVQIAVDFAIKEVISAVVERSVTIAGIATRELVVKDFDSENLEESMIKASHMMASAMAGSLATVSSKEPLSVSIMSHIKVLLVISGYIDMFSEKMIYEAVADSLDDACSVMEKAAADRAIYEVDEAISSIITRRKQQHQAGMDPYNYRHRPQGCSITLPPMLRPGPDGLKVSQWGVYEDFLRFLKSPVQKPHQENYDLSFSDPGTYGQRPPLNSHQMVNQILEEFMKYISELEKKILKSANSPNKGNANLESLGAIINGIQCLSKISHSDDIYLLFTQKVLRLLFKHHHIQLAREVYVSLLVWFCESSMKCANEFKDWFLYKNDNRKYNPVVVLCILRTYLLNPVELDVQMARMILCKNTEAINFSIDILNRFLRHSPTTKIYNTFMQTFEAFLQLRACKEVPMQFEALLESTIERTFSAVKTQAPINRLELQSGTAQIFMNWVATYYHPSSSHISQEFFVLNLKERVLQTEHLLLHFFATCTELSIDSKIFINFAPAELSHLSGLQIADALARLTVLLIKRSYISDPSSQKYLEFTSKVFSIMSLVVINQHEKKKLNFEPRPVFRLMLSLLNDMNSCMESLKSIYPQLLTAYGNMLYVLQHTHAPGFTFHFIQLLSHRNFINGILSDKNNWECFHKLLICLIKSLGTLLTTGKMTEGVRNFYRATALIITMLLNRFPEFLCGYYLSLINQIPHNCIHLRNLILSALPRNIQLPDPFTPNFKIDLLPEIGESPVILSDCISILKSIGILEDLDTYLNTRNPVSFLERLKSHLILPNDESKYNIPAINSLVLYAGIRAVSQMQNNVSQVSIPLVHSPTLDLYQQLITDMDAEGRYYLFSALADHLRYPNRHTHYFSCVMLYLFAEANQEFIQEQITRALVERAIANKPHPYGLLITYLELIKNKRYKFWEHKNFFTCSPDIENMFLAIKKSINQLMVRAN